VTSGDTACGASAKASNVGAGVGIGIAVGMFITAAVRGVIYFVARKRRKDYVDADYDAVALSP
jgi:hypothetical protein